MNLFISQRQRMQLRQVLTAFLVGLTLLVSAAFGQLGFIPSAQAATATPEAEAYQVDQSQDQSFQTEKSENAGGGLIDNIREKLNLDEPLPESTKLFFKQVQGEDVEVEEPRPSGKGNTPLQ